MEGTLFKWTNYWNGWQSRWFVLEGQILSYYISEETIHNGCKGSVSVAVCDVSPHSYDTCRFDIVIPSERVYMYLRSSTPADRQYWIIAIGTAKACMSEKKVSSAVKPVESEANMRIKLSEVRLFCDLLMQQVGQVKEGCDVSVGVDVSKLKEATTLLSETCDTFINSLAGCMSLADRIYSNSPVHSIDQGKIHNPYLPPQPYIVPGGVVRKSDSKNKSISIMENSRSVADTPQETEKIESVSKKVRTFFSSVNFSFVDVKLDTTGGIPCHQIIQASQSMLLFFDVIRHTLILAPVKNGILGNVKKLEARYLVNKQVYKTLQALIGYEIQTNTTKVKNSCTEALFWLVRDLQFVKEFLWLIVKGEENLSYAANVAYSLTLKPFHGWVVRGVFGVAMKTLPYRSELLDSLCVNRFEIMDVDSVETLIIKEMEDYATAIDVLVKQVDKFYYENNISFAQEM